MPAKHLWCCLFVGLITACSSEPIKKTGSLQTKAAVKAPLSAQLPTLTPAIDPYANLLTAAQLAAKAGDYTTVRKKLDALPYASLNQQQRSQFNLLSAAELLDKANAEAALSKLEIVRPKLLTSSEQIDYFQSLAFAHALAGNALNSVYARIRLLNLISAPQQRRDNMTAILNSLNEMPLSVLETPKENTEDLNGWLALAAIIKQQGQPGLAFAEQLKLWRQNFPNHSATDEFLQTYLAQQANTIANVSVAQSNPGVTSQTSANAPFIAVLLPESGTYAVAANAIKQGMLAAQRQAAINAAQMPLKFYDTESSDIAAIYLQAVTAGASQVVGPLIKEQIQILAETTNLTVPVLALNHVEDLSKNNLFQFGLSPLDEAAALTAKARRDGAQSAWILTPNTSQGQRISHYLTAAWQNQGGIVLGTQSYDAKQHDINAVLGALLQANPVVQANEILLLSASPEVGRELAAPLKQHSAIGVYAMPTIYSGHPNPVQDVDLGKINFCDIPWVFAGVYTGPLSQLALQPLWQSVPESQIRLLALGIDAYNLLGRLNQATTGFDYSGASGHLTLDGENRLVRQLVCAQFKAGTPMPTDLPQ